MQPTRCFFCRAPISARAITCPSCHLLLVVQGRFVLREYVNQGGFGKVYKADDLQNPGMVCAVKVVPFESQDQYDQALREVEILQRHRLRFMPYFYTTEIHGDSVYIVTEFIHGNSLSTYQRGFWFPNRVERMVRILLGYLAQLHERAIVHRDLSPTNIMRIEGDSAEYVLLDFGIAKEGTSTISAMRQAGNPGFAAPEQVRGEGTSEASDLYSLGATAYSLLTGDMPTTLERLAGTRLKRPRVLRPDVSPVLDELLVWLLQLDPARRPPSAEAALAWIEQQYRPASQRPASGAGAGVGCAAALVLVALIAVAVIFGSREASGGAGAGPGLAGDTAAPGRVVFTSWRTKTYELYVADGLEAQPTAIAALAGDEFAPVWSPDGQQIVYVRLLNGNYDIYRVTVDGTINLPVAASPATEATPAWSPDGQRIAFSSNRSGDQELYTVSADGSGAWTQLTTNRGTDWCPTWVDDDQIIYISQRGPAWGLYRINVRDGAESLVYPGDGEIFTLAIAPDGGHLAFGMRDPTGNIDIYTVMINGNNLKRLTSNPAEDSYPSWSPDGSQIIFQSKRDDTSRLNAAQLYVVNADGTGETRISQNSIDDRQPAWR